MEVKKFEMCRATNWSLHLRKPRKGEISIDRRGYLLNEPEDEKKCLGICDECSRKNIDLKEILERAMENEKKIIMYCVLKENMK